MYKNRIEIKAAEIADGLRNIGEGLSLDLISREVRIRSQHRIARVLQVVVFEFVLCNLRRHGIQIQQ